MIHFILQILGYRIAAIEALYFTLPQGVKSLIELVPDLLSRLRFFVQIVKNKKEKQVEVAKPSAKCSKQKG
jgi:hypothetical protein